ncbi:MAG: hypothetical protein QW350_01420 [Candidatus Aenigmatarchaeota archaeon]|nr:hypothetical protein [Candidatus Aenigmarchaeota archaeon]
MTNPLMIIFEILYFLIKSLIEAIFFLSFKTIEFLESVAGIESSNILTLIIGSIIVGFVIFIVIKYLFGISKELLIIMIIYFLLIIILIIYKSIS